MTQEQLSFEWAAFLASVSVPTTADVEAVRRGADLLGLRAEAVGLYTAVELVARAGRHLQDGETDEVQVLLRQLVRQAFLLAHCTAAREGV